MDQSGKAPDQESGTPPPAQEQRRFGGTRVRPRVEVGRPKPPPETPSSFPLTPEVLDGAPGDDGFGSGSGGPVGMGGDPFAPRSFAGNRVRVYGCSPGCLIMSLLVSLILTLILNSIF